MMDKSCGEESAASDPNPTSTNPSTVSRNDSTATSVNPGILSGKDQYLKQLNKFSQKISKPPIRKPFDHLLQGNHQNLHQLPLGFDDKQPQNQSQPSNLPQQHQPPVYNINKSDFRDVVQKLTGSPAHERVSAPPAPPVHQPKPQSSRLQRIRPPPLEHVGNRPPPLLNDAVVGGGLLPQNPSSSNNAPAAVPGNFFGGQRQLHQPLSPLPPLPTVHAAAESPISAYMRYFQNANTGVSGPSSLSSPRWNNFPQPPLPPPPSQPQPQYPAVPPRSPSSASLPLPAPSSPLPFGCIPSPKSQYSMLSPGFPFSPTNQFGFQPPVSPTLPVPSPRWKGL